MLVLIRDPELDSLLPAPGFPQTLPGGPTWRALYRNCEASREASGTIAFPDRDTLVPYHALVGADRSVLVLIGGHPVLRTADLDSLGFPLLSALLRAESTVIASAGLAAEARHATARATALADTLDAARSEIAAKARQLGQALEEADRLNRALREFNTTLEERVAEQARERDRFWHLSRDLILVSRFDMSVVSVNPAWEGTLGWSADELAGRSILDVVHPEHCASTVEEYERNRAGVPSVGFENRCRHRDGGYRWISWSSVPDEPFVYAIGRDVTAEKEAAEALRRAQEQLHQAQKMEAVGQLTGGVAHDFNNLLQALSACLRMVERRAPGPPIQPLVEAGRQAIDRGAKLVQQLMAFARRQSLSPEPVDVRDLVLGMSELLARVLRSDIAVETDLAPDLRPVEVDKTQLELAVINLAVNARDAMPSGGRLRIEGRNLPATGDGPGLVRLALADTGTGIPPELLARVFEPFFTTKEPGKGSGMGLAQVYGFMRQSGGTVEIASTPGEGTTVSLLLPATDKAVATLPAALQAIGRVSKGARVLLVEDDPVVGNMVAAVLEDLGYTVLRAVNAAEALAVLNAGGVDVLFSDVVIPGGMNGVDLAQAVRRLRPGLPVVLATGYSEDIARAEGVRVLAKPYRTAALVEALESAMGAVASR